MDVFEKTIEASGRGNFLEKRGEHPTFLPSPELPMCSCHSSSSKFLWLSNPSSQFLQARNFKVEMLERGIPFDAGIVSPVPKKRRNAIQPFVYIRFPERPGFFMPLMSTAADPLGPCLSGPLPRTLPRRRQGGYVPYTAMNYLFIIYRKCYSSRKA